MKSIPASLRSHLDQEVTALCTCWTITRTDGKVLRFTDADEDVVQGGNTYTSIGAYKRTAIESTSTLAVDNLEIVGAASDLALPEEELRTGLFDNAQVTIFMTPWMDSIRGQLKLRRGFFGEVQTIPNGTYQVELRGIMQRLAYNYTDIFSATCLYDLGEKNCGINIKGGDIDIGDTFAVGDFARLAQDTYQRGKAYTIGWTDPDFEEMGAAGGVAQSLNWYNLGPNDLDVNTDSAYTGVYSVRGGTGAGSLAQDVDLEEATKLPVADIDSESCYVTMRAFRRDVSDQGQLQIQFFDSKGSELGRGRQLRMSGFTQSVSQIDLTGDFTVETWIRLDSTPDDQAIFGFGAFTSAGIAYSLSFEGGFLSLRLDDSAASSTVTTVLESTETLAAGEWHHIALTRSGTTLTLYENFEVAATGTYASTISIDEWGGASASTDFVGDWDELRVWDTAREPYELGLYAHTAIDPTTTSLIRYYSFNDTNGGDLTTNDPATFGSGNLQIGLGSPVAVPAIYAYDRGTATYASGYADVGTTWTEIEVVDHRVPQYARLMRVRFDVQAGGTPVESFIDNLTGHFINTGEDGIVLGYMTNNVAWRCTAAGTITADQASGGDTDTISIGADFIGENAYLRAGRVLSSTDARTFICEVEDVRAVDAWFNEGTVIFETGNNAGISMEVKEWNASTRQIELFLSVPNLIKAGDLFSVYPGCDKSRISCAAIFQNIENMFATPDIPGQDELYRFPDAK